MQQGDEQHFQEDYVKIYEYWNDEHAVEELEKIDYWFCTRQKIIGLMLRRRKT
ncbi:hypothetical protein [Thermaerobacillus caldiproteolyticus]|uniref:Uncharacterized protein n=1 Tax=Thermaerobacillus caldiproteolyticus TaxID=247480 RepID=A0A7W0BYX4_9BACL|nr:hypothetical protein [Anoxybacillus caldiproteolyticus]MBA2873911.1 hypothetical protein [Anoxybacillus caldiproteolyticus]QPA33359.1 hypothetical protein ISX45_12600 [Anoxybacillus caldiproteolyticus]